MRRGDLDRARADAANASSSLGEALALLAIVALVLSIWVFLSGCGGADFDLVARIAAEEEVSIEVEAGIEIGGGDDGVPGDDGADDGAVEPAPDGGGDDGLVDGMVGVDSAVGEVAPVDSGASDSGPKDTGSDSGASVDSGASDSGPKDTGPVDTGPTDTGTAADVRICQEGTTAGYPPGEDCALGSLDCCTGPCVYVATMCCGRGRCM